MKDTRYKAPKSGIVMHKVFGGDYVFEKPLHKVQGRWVNLYFTTNAKGKILAIQQDDVKGGLGNIRRDFLLLAVTPEKEREFQKLLRQLHFEASREVVGRE